MNPVNQSSIRSYQVKGYTNSADKWDIDNYTCMNQEGCWGPQLRFLEIQHASQRWMFNFYNKLEAQVNNRKMKSHKNVEKLYIR